MSGKLGIRDVRRLEIARTAVRKGALDQNPIVGLTHQFYRYPARFSPAFARACIEAFSQPGEVVLDPYMGGGTTVIEAMAAGRRAIGSDINSLSVFVASTKVNRLTSMERKKLSYWADSIVPILRCTDRLDPTDPETQHRPRNMSPADVRWLRKFIAVCLSSTDERLTSANSKQFARCAVLNVGQWALNGRKQIPTVSEFRSRLRVTCQEMLCGVLQFEEEVAASAHTLYDPVLRQNDAEAIHRDEVISRCSPADLVVTSPPYPGIHMLYHRWQVDGRKETNAPYWIAACQDGDGATHYNFADRKPQRLDRYFEKAENAFSSVRTVMRDGAVLAQMVAFSDPQRHLPRYLNAMRRAGFSELRQAGQHRTWRQVPGRRWHAALQGKTSSSREVVLLHIAD